MSFMLVFSRNTSVPSPQSPINCHQFRTQPRSFLNLKPCWTLVLFKRVVTAPKPRFWLSGLGPQLRMQLGRIVGVFRRLTLPSSLRTRIILGGRNDMFVLGFAASGMGQLTVGLCLLNRRNCCCIAALRIGISWVVLNNGCSGCWCFHNLRHLFLHYNFWLLFQLLFPVLGKFSLAYK